MGQVQVDPEEIDGIVKLTRKVSKQISGDHALAEADLSLASFGNYDEAQGLVSIHGTAHQVVRATLVGVRDDLDGFATNIENAVADLLDRDLTTQQLLTSTLAPFNPLGLGSGGSVDVYNDLDDETLAGLGGVSATSHGDDARDEIINGLYGGNA